MADESARARVRCQGHRHPLKEPCHGSVERASGRHTCETRHYTARSDTAAILGGILYYRAGKYRVSPPNSGELSGVAGESGYDGFLSRQVRIIVPEKSFFLAIYLVSLPTIYVSARAANESLLVQRKDSRFHGTRLKQGDHRGEQTCGGILVKCDRWQRQFSRNRSAPSDKQVPLPYRMGRFCCTPVRRNDVGGG